MGWDQEGLEILKILEWQCPKEPQVHIQLGKLKKKMGKKKEALSHFNKALDLDPKDQNTVKSLIEGLNNDNDMDEDNDI